MTSPTKSLGQTWKGGSLAQVWAEAWLNTSVPCGVGETLPKYTLIPLQITGRDSPQIPVFIFYPHIIFESAKCCLYSEP